MWKILSAGESEPDFREMQMNCPLCDTEGASTTEKHDLDWTVLHCTQCGEIIFTKNAHIELDQLGANERRRVADYCRNRNNPSEIITLVRLKEIT
jgi:transcription elongation factor Elf1